MSKSIHQIVKENIDKDHLANLEKLTEQGWSQDIYTKDNLEHAAKVGSVKATKLIAAHNRINHDAKIDAMFVAAQAHQVETVKALSEAGVSLTYAFGAISDHESFKPFVEALLNPVTGLGYDPSDEDLHFLRLAGKTNVLTAIDERNSQHQALYKEAFQTYITDPHVTEAIKDETTILSASATGTAAHIDYHVANGQAVNNKGFLQNLDVALWHSNSGTAQALIKHGAEVKPEYVEIARRYCDNDTVSLLKSTLESQLVSQHNQELRPKQNLDKKRERKLTM